MTKHNHVFFIEGEERARFSSDAPLPLMEVGDKVRLDFEQFVVVERDFSYWTDGTMAVNFEIEPHKEIGAD